MLNQEKYRQDPRNYFLASIDNFTSMKLSSSSFFGHVLSYNGQVIEATALPGIIGSICSIYSQNGEIFMGEVVSVKEDKVEVLPYESNLDVRVGDKISLNEIRQEVCVGDTLLGRVIDGLGNPLDGRGSINLKGKKGLNGTRLNPFNRNFELPVDYYPPGVYIIRVISEGRIENFKLLKR